jgi:hypothetical protein
MHRVHNWLVPGSSRVFFLFPLGTRDMKRSLEYRPKAAPGGGDKAVH